jgi:hypothetical protein
MVRKSAAGAKVTPITAGCWAVVVRFLVERRSCGRRGRERWAVPCLAIHPDFELVNCALSRARHGGSAQRTQTRPAPEHERRADLVTWGSGNALRASTSPRLTSNSPRMKTYDRREKPHSWDSRPCLICPPCARFHQPTGHPSDPV